MSTWSEKVETSSNPFRTYQVNTTVVQPCCKEYFSNAPYIPIVPRNLTLTIEKLDEAGTTAISMAEVNKTCKGVSTNNDRMDVQCESQGYNEVKQCSTPKVVKADGIPIELTFGTFFNQFLHQDGDKEPLTHLNDILRVTIEKEPSNSSVHRRTEKSVFFLAIITMSLVNNYVNLIQY